MAQKVQTFKGFLFQFWVSEWISLIFFQQICWHYIIHVYKSKYQYTFDLPQLIANIRAFLGLLSLSSQYLEQLSHSLSFSLFIYFSSTHSLSSFLSHSFSVFISRYFAFYKSIEDTFVFVTTVLNISKRFRISVFLNYTLIWCLTEVSSNFRGQFEI